MKTKLELWQALESIHCITYNNSDEADVMWRKNDLYGRNAFRIKVSVLDSLKTSPAVSFFLCKIACGTRRRKKVPSFFCGVRVTHSLFSSFLALLLIIMLTALRPRRCTGECYSGCSCNYVLFSQKVMETYFSLLTMI